MVDILDMEDIFYEIIKNYPRLNKKNPINMAEARLMAIKLIKEVEDFVEGQQTIECNNCKGRKLKYMKEPWQVQ